MIRKLVLIGTVMISASAQAGNPAQIKAGAAVFERWCAACHSDGDNYAGTVALRAKYHGELPAVLTRRTDLDSDTVKYFVRHGISVMPFFRKTEISATELDALAAYLTSHNKK